MTISTSWKLHATTQDEMTLKDGTVLTDVVLTVHWECFATDDETGEVLRIYGEQPVPAPETTEGFIDLAVLQGMDDQKKRDTVLRWAEIVAPGFVSEIEAATVSRLNAKQAEPVKAVVPIL